MAHNRLWAMKAAVLFLGICTAASAGGIRVWNYHVLDNAFRETDRGELQTMRIEAARGGTFSGAVAVESDEPLIGLRAELVGGDGPNPMPGSAGDAVQVRYATRWTGGRNLPPNLDVLLEEPPEEIAVHDGRALAGVWVTVTVPDDMEAGRHVGELRIGADGLQEALTVPVELNVAGWQVPDSGEWRTWIEMMQSPDTLALEYDVPLWSDEHFELIAKSFRLIRDTGSRVVYVHLIRETNQGNEESMLRWVRGEDGSLEPDYAVVERYLDVAQENLGEIDKVVLYAWDAYLAREHRGRSREERPEITADEGSYAWQQQQRALQQWEQRQKGLEVTIVDGESGEAEPGHLPHYWEEESRGIWKPVYDDLRSLMRERGLEDAMHMAMITDFEPMRDEHEFFNEVTGGLPWIAHSHYRRKHNRPMPNTILRGIAPLAYEAHAYSLSYTVNPAVARQYGWRIPELRAYLCRFGQMNGHPLIVRLLPKVSITGLQRGMGRLGGDFWSVVRDSRDRRSGMVHARYPHNHWRGLNINSYFLAPGQDGPVATARLENLRESVQECEARIFIESVLLDDEQLERIGEDLAGRAQEILDERQMALWMGFWPDEEDLEILGRIEGRSMHEAIWNGLSAHDDDLPGYWDSAARRKRSEMGGKGQEWFAESDWLDRNARLFEVAAEVQERLE